MWKRGLLACVALAGCDGAAIPSDYSEQFITLPSGARAYCNRQGFREVRRTYTYEENQLVTDPNGNFVECDARVGPDWDSERVEADGRVLTETEFLQRDMERRLAERDQAAEARDAAREREGMFNAMATP